MTENLPNPVVHAKQLTKPSVQIQAHLTVRELWNELYSLTLAGHGDDRVRLFTNRAMFDGSPLLLGVLRANRETEVWISDTDDVL